MYILWIRHGFSCGNYMKMTDPLYKLTGFIEYDAPLTKLGSQQASEAGPLIFDKVSSDYSELEIVPIFFSSLLSRALSTANNIKKGIVELDSETSTIPIVAIPHVEEISEFPTIQKIYQVDKQNEPQNINVVRKELPFEVNVLRNLNPYKESGKPKEIVSLKKFYNNALPKIVENLKDSFGYKVHKNSIIVIVSHGNLMKKATGIKVGNIGSVLQKVSKTPQGYKPGLDSELIFPGFLYEYYKDEVFTPDDVKSCRSRRVRNSIFKKG